jgi:hypothetical protein
MKIVTQMIDSLAAPSPLNLPLTWSMRAIYLRYISDSVFREVGSVRSVIRTGLRDLLDEDDDEETIK